MLIKVSIYPPGHGPVRRVHLQQADVGGPALPGPQRPARPRDAQVPRGHHRPLPGGGHRRPAGHPPQVNTDLWLVKTLSPGLWLVNRMTAGLWWVTMSSRVLLVMILTGIASIPMSRATPSPRQADSSGKRRRRPTVSSHAIPDLQLSSICIWILD